MSKYRDGDSDSALKLVENGNRESENRDAVWNWKFKILKAQILRRKHAAEQSAALLSTAVPPNLPADVRAQKRIVEAIALCHIGKMGQKDLLEEAGGLITPAEYSLRAQLAYARAECEPPNDSSRARALYLQSAELAHDHDPFWEALALGNAAYELMQQRRYDEANQEFKAAQEVTSSPFLKESLLGNRGYCYEQLGDWISSRTYLEQAENLAAQVKDATADRALWLIDLGLERFSQLKYQEATDFFSRALPIAQASGREDLTAQALNNLAWVALVSGEKQRAQQYLQQSEDLHLSGAPHSFLLLSKARLARMNGQLAEAESLLKNLLTSNPSFDAKWQALTDLAVIYWDQQRFAEAEATFKEAAMAAQQSADQVTSDESRISLLDRNPFYDEYIRFLVARNRPLDALAIAEKGRSPALARALQLPAGDGKMNLTALQGRLRNRQEIVLAYWLSPKESYLWAITPSQVKLVKLAPEMDIVSAVQGYSDEVLEVRSPDQFRFGQKLYDMLIAPAERLIPKGAHIIVVPHRRLYKVNFETLVATKPNPHFWVKDVDVQNVSFLAVLEKRHRSDSGYLKDLLLIGAPVEVTKDFPGLAHAPEEMQKVAVHFPRSMEKLIDGKNATPASYSSSDPREFRYLHFVTHGAPSDANPLDSAIILSSGPSGYKLYARDITQTKIHPELVTISSCYGAGTRQYSGEGLVGLAWAFMRAGAHQVVAALWEVDDKETADLMNDFYDGLKNRMSVAEALRNAKLNMLRSNGKRKRPFYWASLQVYTGP